MANPDPASLRKTLSVRLARHRPLRAGAFIVTIYGDLILPRGVAVWIGDIIETCALVEISETLVRTTISRMVNAGLLIGHRQGRRSFYRLSQDRLPEFHRAAALIYGSGEASEPSLWTLAILKSETRRAAQEALTRIGFGHVGSGVCLKPGNHVDAAQDAVKGIDRPILFLASSDPVRDKNGPGFSALAELAWRHWDMRSLEIEYRFFCETFAPLHTKPELCRELTPEDSLAIHLLLVHAFRLIALTDPDLPGECLPSDWVGHKARKIFTDLHKHLHPAVDRLVCSRFICEPDPLGSENRQ